MNFLKNITKPILLIVPSVQKQYILKQLSIEEHLFPVKILTFSEFLKKYDFDYTKETLLYMKEKYGLCQHSAEVYLENMYYLDEVQSTNRQVIELLKIKTELLEQNMIQRDFLFRKSLKNKHIIFYGYDYYLKQQYKIIENLKKDTEVDVYTNHFDLEKQLSVYQFQTMEEEVEYLFQNIGTLLERGVPYHKIKLADVGNEYHETLIRYSKLYQIPIGISTKVSVYETIVGKKAIQLLNEGKNFSEILLLLDELFREKDIIQLILKLFNQYVLSQDKKEVVNWIVEDMRVTYLQEQTSKEQIELLSLANNHLEEDWYVFLLGFNNGNFPKIQKDEDFFSDLLKKELSFTTSEEKNKLERESLINHLFVIPHLTITYKVKTYFEEYYPSTLIQDYNMKVISEIAQFDTHYSKTFDQMKLAILLDRYIQYGEKHPLLEKYYSTFKIPYLTYDHQYKKIDSQLFKRYLPSKLILSYSSLDRFYHCQFRYFLQDILKIQKFEDTLSSIIGNIFHSILSRCFNDEFQFDEEYKKEVEKYSLGFKEQFYLEKLKPDMLFTINIIQAQNKITGFSNQSFEERILIPQNTSFPTVFTGIIDKILYKEKNNQKLLTIIDYKTGTPNLDLKLVPFGFCLQLPTYMYLIRKSSKYKDSKICGIYLQKILNSIPSNTEDVEFEKKEALKLRGYSISDESLLEQWDPTYENSEVIKNLRKTKNGWYQHAKLLSQEEMETLVDITEKKMKGAIEDILNAEFSINPKRVDGVNIGCEFCKFQDICYRKENDIVDLVA